MQLVQDSLVDMQHSREGMGWLQSTSAFGSEGVVPSSPPTPAEGSVTGSDGLSEGGLAGAMGSLTGPTFAGSGGGAEDAHPEMRRTTLHAAIGRIGRRMTGNRRGSSSLRYRSARLPEPSLSPPRPLGPERVHWSRDPRATGPPRWRPRPRRGQRPPGWLGKGGYIRSLSGQTAEPRRGSLPRLPVGRKLNNVLMFRHIAVLLWRGRARYGGFRKPSSNPRVSIRVRIGLVSKSTAPAPDGETNARCSPPVLLVHGIWDTAVQLEPLASALRSAEPSRPVESISLEPNDGSATIDVLASQVADAASEMVGSMERLDLVGFSMGALACRYFVQRLGGRESVRKFVSLAGPHAGTWTAFAATKAGAKQMRPKSDLLCELAKDEDPWGPVEVHCLWTPLDLMIVPAGSGRLPHARSDERIAVALHRWMITDRRVLRRVCQLLSE